MNQSLTHLWLKKKTVKAYKIALGEKNYFNEYFEEYFDKASKEDIEASS